MHMGGGGTRRAEQQKHEIHTDAKVWAAEKLRDLQYTLVVPMYRGKTRLSRDLATPLKAIYSPHTQTAVKLACHRIWLQY